MRINAPGELDRTTRPTKKKRRDLDRVEGRARTGRRTPFRSARGTIGRRTGRDRASRATDAPRRRTGRTRPAVDRRASPTGGPRSRRRRHVAPFPVAAYDEDHRTPTSRTSSSRSRLRALRAAPDQPLEPVERQSRSRRCVATLRAAAQRPVTIGRRGVEEHREPTVRRATASSTRTASRSSITFSAIPIFLRVEKGTVASEEHQQINHPQHSLVAGGIVGGSAAQAAP